MSPRRLTPGQRDIITDRPARERERGERENERGRGKMTN